MKKLIYVLLMIPAVLYCQPDSSVSYRKTGISNSYAPIRLSLDSCKILAMSNNYRIKEAANEVTQSEEVKKSAFTSYFPKVNAGFSAAKMSDYMVKGSIPQMNLPVYDGNPANLPIATQFTYFPGMALNLVDYLNFGYAMAAQPVFTGGRIYNGNKLAKTGVEIYRVKESLTITETLVKTEELYWNIISLNEKLVTVDSYRKLLDTLNRDVSAAVKAGLIQRTDLLKIQLKQNELEMNRLSLTDGIALSIKALCQHIGIHYDSMVVLTDTPVITVDPASLFVNPDEAVRNRNEYKILEKAVRAEELQQRIVTGEYLPQVAVGVAGVYTDVMDKTDQVGVAFATISVPISDWWGGTHKIRQGKAKVENANNKLGETAELLSLQITRMQNELYQNYFRIGNAEKSLEQAQENMKVTKDNYDAGVTGMSDLLEAQSLYQEAVNSLTEAKCNYQVSMAKYMEAINRYK
ncbi:MAG: TolC family protein [Bacteroidetes bacterium]|nr:TolC family protein [Bacteroidota bacterium]